MQVIERNSKAAAPVIYVRWVLQNVQLAFEQAVVLIKYADLKTERFCPSLSCGPMQPQNDQGAGCKISALLTRPTRVMPGLKRLYLRRAASRERARGFR